MSEKKNLTEMQQYLQYLLPNLSDTQVQRMITAAKETAPKRFGGVSEKESSPYSELMAMVGCDEAKKQLNAMIADYRMSKIAEARGRKHVQSYYHMVFSGNPGCAKTTCARLYAQALAQEGITKNNRFVELSRSSIVGQYVGATAPKVHDIFNKYDGGVIFIDEAYSLCDSDRASNNNYGDEAITEMIACMENHPGTVVIFAGYPERMEQFLGANPGLRSRVPYQVSFSDYSAEELVAISRKLAAERGFTISDPAAEKLIGIYQEARVQKDFGNGRYARNLVEAAIRTKGINLGVMNTQNMDAYLNTEQFSDEALFSLDENCFCVEQKPKQAPRKIGFHE